MSGEPRPIDASLPARLREFHGRFPLEGDPPNATLALPDDQIHYLTALLWNRPRQAPVLSIEEWHHFIHLLRSNGVCALFAYHLRTWPDDCRPPVEVVESLHRTLLIGAARAIRMGRQIHVIVDALESAGIPSVLLKGPALARTVYPDPALRWSSDIDLLVRPGDVIAAEAILGNLGYISPHREFHTRPYAYHQEFVSPDGGIPLELHWSLDCGYHLVPEGESWVVEAIERRVSLQSDDLSASTLASIDHIPFLGLHHGFQHDLLRLNQIADIQLLVSQLVDPHDWYHMIASAERKGLLVPLQFAARIADLWGEAGIARKYQDPDQWPDIPRREVRLWGHMKARRSKGLSSFMSAMHREPGLLDKVRYGCRFILPPEAVLSKYRKSDSSMDIPVAHLRRWLSLTRYR